MVVLQAIVSLLTRSVGKIFSALFDWAVVALFGRVAGRQKVWLSALMGAAALWPVLLLGIAVPKISALAIAFVPLSGVAPAHVLRGVWIALAIVVPAAVGVALRLEASPGQPRATWLGALVRGFPITLGLSAAFLVLLVTVPVLRISALRGREDIHVPLITTRASAPVAAELILATLRRPTSPSPRGPLRGGPRHRRGFSRAPSWRGLRAYVPTQTAYFRGPDLEVAPSPNTVSLRGKAHAVAGARPRRGGPTGHPDMLQTTSVDTQEIERQIQRVWRFIFRQSDAHRHARPLISRLEEIAGEIARRALPFDEWQIELQPCSSGGRSLGEPQLTEQMLGEQHPVVVPAPEPEDVQRWHRASTTDLVGRTLEVGARLVSKEVQLARAEVEADLSANLGMLKMLAVAGAGALLTVSMLLFAVVTGLGLWIPGWAAAIALGVAVIAASGLAARSAWKRRIGKPLALTRASVMEHGNAAEDATRRSLATANGRRSSPSAPIGVACPRPRSLAPSFIGRPSSSRKRFTSLTRRRRQTLRRSWRW